MSLFKVVKLLYSLTFSMLYFIIWNLIAFLIVGLMPDTRIFFLELILIYLMQFLSERYSKKEIIFLPPCILGIIVIILMYGVSDYLANIIYLVLNLFILAKEDENSVEYSTYRKKVLNGVYSLAAIGVTLIAVNDNFRTYQLRFYILFLISSIILLRESRRFRYNIKGKKSILANLIIMLSVVILTTDRVFNLVTIILKAFWAVISYITGIIIVILVRLLTPLINYLEYQISRIPNKIKGMQPAEMDPGKSLDELMKIKGDTIAEIPPQAVLAFKLILLFIITALAYRIYKKYRYNGRKEHQGIVEKREKIIKENTKEKKSLINSLKGIFEKEDTKIQILKVFQSFEKKTYEKNIFKKHMTATQLYNISRVYIDKSKNIKDITEIYNRTKFSQHLPSVSELKEIKDKYKVIKSQIDDVKN